MERESHESKRLSHQIGRQHWLNLRVSQSKNVDSNHTGPINCLDLDQIEHRYLLSGGGDNKVSIFDVSEKLNSQPRGFHAVPLTPEKWGQGHTASVSCVAWYPVDTGIFLSGCDQGIVKVWDTNRLHVVHEFKFSRPYLSDMPPPPPCISAIGLTPTGQHSLAVVAAHGNRHARLCDLNSGQYSHNLVGHDEDVLCAVWSPSSQHMLATSGLDFTVRLWDIRRTKSFLTLDQDNTADHFALYSAVRAPGAFQKSRSHNDSVVHVAFTRDAQRLISYGLDRHCRVWDLLTGRHLCALPPLSQHHPNNKFCLSPDGNLLFSADGPHVAVFDLQAGARVGTLAGHFDRVTCCVVNANRLP
jgi:DNA excision repair protein ERCC-8